MNVSDNGEDWTLREGTGVTAGPEFTDSWHINEMAVELMDRPLDFLFAEHLRQRQAAFILEKISEGQFDWSGVRDLITFLEQDFADHVADEEVVFFPVLREKCKPEDKIDELLARLAAEHKEDELVGEQVIDCLRKLAGGGELISADVQRLKAFALHINDHVALENAILLPLARVRLDSDSLAFVAEMLKDRRTS